MLPDLFRYGVLPLVVVFASILCILALALFLTHTRAAAILLIVVILSFITATSFGYLDAPTFSVYNKGTRTFFFPLIQYYLYGLFFVTLFHNKLVGRTLLKGAGDRWMLAFAALFAIHVAYGLATGIPLALVLSTGGLLNVLHLSMIAYITANALRDDDSLVLLVRLLVGIVLLRGCYALVRFLFAGGDPQNAYSNVSQLALKVTFWDASEGLIAALVVFYCAGRLLRGWNALSLGARAFCALAIGVELLVILLSYRRTSWYGLLFASAYLTWQLPRNKRAVPLVLAALSILLPVIYLSTIRFQKTLGQGNLSLIERLAPDIDTRNSVSSPSSRFYELYTASETVRRNPLVGVGAWGDFDVGVNDAGLEYHQGNFGFVHSGFGHVLLKSGLVGLFLFCGMLLSPWRFARRARTSVPERRLPAFDSCRAGLVFMIPSLLAGTPIVEFRAMALMGVLLAVPIAIAKMASGGGTPGVAVTANVLPSSL